MTKPTLPDRPLVDVRARLADLDKPDDRPEVMLLLSNIHRDLDVFDRPAKVDGEESVYRFYHQSFKVYGIKQTTRTMVEALVAIHPRSPAAFHSWFSQIIDAGLAPSFEYSDNDHWHEATGPLLEAFFHARYFVEQVARYGHALTEPPRVLPYGWAAILELYGLRDDRLGGSPPNT